MYFNNNIRGYRFLYLYEFIKSYNSIQNFNSQKPSVFILRKFSCSPSTSNGIYILSAVRTPIRLVKGSLLGCTAPQLGAVALKEALERARVPFHDIQDVFMGHTFCKKYNGNSFEEVTTLAGLSKTTICHSINSSFTSGLKSLLLAHQFLANDEKDVCAAGGMESMSSLSDSEVSELGSKIILAQKEEDVVKYLKNCSFDKKNYSQNDYERLKKAYKHGTFQDEIVQVMFRRKGEQVIVAEDELVKMSNLLEENFDGAIIPGDGAAAVVLATKKYVLENNLSPLAEIISFSNNQKNSSGYLSGPLWTVKKALDIAKCQPKQIAQWEIYDHLGVSSFNIMEHFNLNHSLINKNGGITSLGNPVGMSGARILCHLAHSLSSQSLGCAAACDMDGKTVAVIIKKLKHDVVGVPKLTLYTKHPCPLCEELKQQLQPFEGRFILEEVNIEAEENKRFRKLYRYEIPVLFMNGRFLCKHRLDADYFIRRIVQAEEDTLT